MSESIDSAETNTLVPSAEEQLPAYVKPPDSLMYVHARPDTPEEAFNRAQDIERAKREFELAWDAYTHILDSEALAPVIAIDRKRRQQLGRSASQQFTRWPGYADGRL